MCLLISVSLPDGNRRLVESVVHREHFREPGATPGGYREVWGKDIERAMTKSLT
jgi:hypothetical protein